MPLTAKTKYGSILTPEPLLELRVNCCLAGQIVMYGLLFECLIPSHADNCILITHGILNKFTVPDKKKN